MDRLTEQLLAIESEAQEAMNAMAKESARLARKAEEDLAARIAKIEREGAEAIRQLGYDTEGNAAARIAEIQDEYRHKWKTFESDVQNARIDLRSRIVREVLHGAL